MTLEKFLRGVVLTGVFALPFIALYVANSMFFPFITGKNFAFRIITEIVAGAWLALAFIRSEYRPRSSWLLWAFAAFVVIIGIADIFGVYPMKSIWSNYERMEGWVTLAHLFAYFLVTVSILNTEKLWRTWWYTSLGVSVLVGFIGVFQFFGFTGINQGSTRLDARLGNATYAAVYMLFHIFIAALFIARLWADKAKDKGFYTWLLASIIFLDSFVLFFSGTRGAILGLLGGALLSAIILIILAPRSRVAWRAGTAIVGFLVLAGGFWLVKDQAWVRNIEPLHRIATLNNDGITIARVLNAQMAWEGFKERPILGWGQENYAVVFDKNYLPAMYAQEQWFDRTHNIVMDWLIAGGILGLLAYLSLHFFALLMVWRSGAFAPYEKALITGFFAAYFFYLIFTFDNIMSYILFVSLLAYITVRAQSVKPQERVAGPVEPKYLPVVAVVVLIGTWGIGWYTNASMISANHLLIQAIQPQPQGAERNLDLFQEALAKPRAGHQEIREQLAQAAMSAAGTEGISNDVKQRFVSLAVSEMDAQSGDSPLAARPPFFLGVLLNRIGAYPEAKTVLEKAQSLSPYKQGIMFERALNAEARGATDEALAIFKEAYDLAPASHEATINYATALLRAGKDAEADEIFRPLVEKGETVDQRIAAAYAGRGRYDKIIEIWTRYIEMNPTVIEARFVLAGAYYSAGDSARAVEVLEDAKRDIPSAAAQVDALIQQVRGE
jgi:tetratricopeptide (TPR) repeat protein/O-antigen ligase